MGLVGPLGLVLHRHVVGQFHTPRRVIRLDAGMPFVEEAHHRTADRLVGVAEAQSTRVDATDVVGRLQQDDRSPFPRRRDGRAEATGRGTIDNDIGPVLCLRRVGEGREGDQEEQSRVEGASSDAFRTEGHRAFLTDYRCNDSVIRVSKA
mgnify:CR=1 FL=1